MTGSPERVKIQRSSDQKLGRFMAAFRSYRSKTLKTVNFGQKMARKYQNFTSIQSMIFSKRTIRTTSIPKIRKIHNGIWKLQAQNFKIGVKWIKCRYSMTKNSPYQNFPGIYTIIFSKKTTRVVSIPKIMKVYSAFERYRPKTLKNGYFGQKMAKF